MTDKFEQEYGHISAALKDLQGKQYELFARKMLSYGHNNITLGSNLETEEEKRLALTGVWIRMRDKIERIRQLLLLNNENPLADEPVEDAWIDIATYGLIALLISNNEWKK